MLNSDQKYETSINSGKQGKGEKIIREAKKMKPPHSSKFQIRCAQDLNTKRKKNTWHLLGFTKHLGKETFQII